MNRESSDTATSSPLGEHTSSSSSAARHHLCQTRIKCESGALRCGNHTFHGRLGQMGGRGKTSIDEAGRALALGMERDL